MQFLWWGIGAQKAMNERLEGRGVGLVGGLGVGATIFYYRELVKAHAVIGYTPNLVIIHADVDRVLKYAAAREIIPMAEYLAGLVRRLSAAGAEFAVLPSITPHLCASELEALSPIPLVNMVDEIVREVHVRGLKKVSLFGTRFTIESRLFGRLDELDVVPPRVEEIDVIHQIYLEIVNAGMGTERQYKELRGIAHTLCSRDGVEAIVLAGTELALLFDAGNTDFPHIDGARLNLNAIMRQVTMRPDRGQ
jgi:aspartate racemase